MRKSWYVGAFYTRGPQQSEAFACAGQPTPAAYPQYNYVIGPFRTKRTAVLCASLSGADDVARTVGG